MNRFKITIACLTTLTAFIITPFAHAVFVPGTLGHIVPEATASFDDPGWTYDFLNGESSTTYTNVDGGTTHRIIEDAGRGNPDTVQRNGTLFAAGGGALTIAAQDGVDSQRGLVWQHNQAVVSGGGLLTPDMRPSSIMYAHVPDPATWPQPPIYDDFFAAFTTAHTKDASGPYWPGFRASTWTAGGVPAWTFDTDQEGWIDIPITEAGWWTLGSSLDDDGLHYFLREGIGELSMDDWMGSFESGNIAGVTGMFGHDLVVHHRVSEEPGPDAPDWTIDEMQLFVVPEPSAILLLTAATAILALRRRKF